MGKTPERIEPNFLVVDVRDVITCFKLCDNRLMGLGLTEGQSSPFSIDFDGYPYNSLTILCERVIMIGTDILHCRFLICSDTPVNAAPAECTSTSLANPDPAGFRKYKSGTALVCLQSFRNKVFIV